jgi:hypothetical protein
MRIVRYAVVECARIDRLDLPLDTDKRSQPNNCESCPSLLQASYQISNPSPDPGAPRGQGRRFFQALVLSAQSPNLLFPGFPH